MAEAQKESTAPANETQSATARAATFSDEALQAVESGHRSALDAVRKFLDTVDEALPMSGDGPSRRQEIVDSAMEMADRLVHTQYTFVREVVSKAGDALDTSSEKE